MIERSYEQYFRQNRLPHLWCPGCGNGIAMKAIVQAIEKKGLDRDKTVIVSGIGCSSRASGYMDFDTPLMAVLFHLQLVSRWQTQT